jgi:hypothetical protein
VRKNPVDLKGHGFSRAIKSPKREPALAAEGMQTIHNAIPQGLKPNISFLPSRGTAEAVPFQNGSDCLSQREFSAACEVVPQTRQIERGL